MRTLARMMAVLCLVGLGTVGCGGGSAPPLDPNSITISKGPPPQETYPIVSQVLAEFKPQASPATLDVVVRSTAAKYYLGPVVYRADPPWYLFVVAPENVNAVIRILKADPNIETAEPNAFGMLASRTERQR